MFFFKRVELWANHPQTREEYCLLEDLNLGNTCQEMLAYTLLRAIEDLTERLGEYDIAMWKLGNLNKVKYVHPFGETPLAQHFEVEKPSMGSLRTPKMSARFYHDASQDGHLMTIGSVFRSVFDLAEPTSAYFAQDMELDQTWLYARTPMERGGLVHIWENGRYFRLPTKEMADEIRFKLRETQDSTYLYPKQLETRPEKPKGGCPFGFE